MREKTNKSDSRSDGVIGSDDSRRDSLLKDLLEVMASGDAAALEDLLLSNPELAECYHRADPCIQQLRDALSLSSAVDASQGNADRDAGFLAAVAQIKDQLGPDSLNAALSRAKASEHASILTDVTRQLSAAQAKHLFEKLAPMLAYTTLKHLNRDVALDEVDRVAARLCSADALVSMQSAEHVRDALIDEFALTLGSDAVRGRLDREQMIALLEESGTMGDLVAMANCLTLAKTQAG